LAFTQVSSCVYAIGIVFFFLNCIKGLHAPNGAKGLRQKTKKKILEASKHHMIILDSKLYVEIWIKVDFQ
jgi:hypothetical protein